MFEVSICCNKRGAQFGKLEVKTECTDKILEITKEYEERIGAQENIPVFVRPFGRIPQDTEVSSFGGENERHGTRWCR